MLAEPGNQFSLTRAALSTCGRAKTYQYCQSGQRLRSADLPSDFLEIDIVSHRFPEPALVGVGVKPRRDDRDNVRAGGASRQRGGRQ